MYGLGFRVMIGITVVTVRVFRAIIGTTAEKKMASQNPDPMAVLWVIV